MLCDHHTHTHLCGHAAGEPVDYARAAREAGLSALGVADHNPMPGAFDDWRMRLDDLPRYIDMVEAAREAVAPFPVRLGLEVDYLEGGEAWVEELAGRADWDYFIGSVHYIAPGWDVDNERWKARLRAAPADSVWQTYYRLVEKSIRSELFDIIGHVDLPKKFGHAPPDSLETLFMPCVEAAVECGVAFEINTSGWHKDCHEQYPSGILLRHLSEAGVQIAIGSDAHDPRHVARDFSRAVGLAREAGFRHIVSFEKRAAATVPLTDLPAYS